MTQQTVDLIIEWFDHIQQMATDRKTLTGAVMNAQHCLNEIAAIASSSKQFVEEYRYEREPIDKKQVIVNQKKISDDHIYEKILKIIELYNKYKGNLNDDGTAAIDEQIAEWIVPSVEDCEE